MKIKHLAIAGILVALAVTGALSQAPTKQEAWSEIINSQCWKETVNGHCNSDKDCFDKAIECIPNKYLNDKYFENGDCLYPEPHCV